MPVCSASAAGDRGFDPLRLGATWGNPPDESDSSQSRIGWLVRQHSPSFIIRRQRRCRGDRDRSSPFVQLEGELYNGRVAMLAVVGILTVEALGRGPWWQAYNSVSYRVHVSITLEGNEMHFYRGPVYCTGGLH